ncbi:MAG TPA: hypothetical protein VFJ07_07835 [Streptosporangiaceae bacterium]|nr:hypothetical protein [Streptosporangiaceae bacterium]
MNLRRMPELRWYYGYPFALALMAAVCVAADRRQPDRGGDDHAAGATTRWQPYFEVADCDIAAAAVTANGGTVVVPASDVPGVGRFAVALDPDGAQFSVIASVPA